MTEKYKQEDWLRRKYHGQGMSVHDIADQTDVCHSTIHRNLKKNDIERRSSGPGQIFGTKKYHDIDYLQEKFHDEGMSYSEIADLNDVSKQTIYNSAKRVGLDAEGDTRYKNREWFYNKHVEESKPLYEIAEMCDVSRPHIIKWRKKHGIDFNYPTGEDNSHTKPDDECVKRKRGQDWNNKRNQALERADYACENPQCEEDADSLGQNPDVHHIVPHRFDDEYDVNELSNLVVLCRSCHAEAEPPREVYL